MTISNDSGVSHTDVLIVGAGPAGLMAANALGALGIGVRIVDQRAVGVSAGQADGIQPRTIEIFQSYGLGDRLIKEGNQMHMAAFYNPNADGIIEVTDRVPDVSVPNARYPFEITLHQGAIEAVLLDSMRSHAIEVERPITPVAIQLNEYGDDVLGDPEAYPVKVTLRNMKTEKDEVVRAKFVIGADGAHSWVRKSLNIAMEGEQTEDVWGVIDILPNSDFPDIRNKTVVHSKHGSCMIIPREEDKIRVYIQLEGDLISKALDSNGRVVKAKLGPDQLLSVAQKILSPYKLDAVDGFEWWTIYTVGQRVASRYGVRDRIFIVGDACHTHSPKAGQGMNASMGDSHNLAWKIASVVRGWADMSLLSTYESERRQYAQDLIAFDKKFAKLFSGKPRTQQNEDGVSHDEFLKIFQTFGGFTSGTGINYGTSSIIDLTSQSLAARMHLSIGQRFPSQTFIRAADARPIDIQDMLISDGKFKILVFLGVGYHLQEKKVNLDAMAKALGHNLARFVPSNDIFEKFNIVTVAKSSRKDVRLNAFPPLLRSHWSKVLLDETDSTVLKSCDCGIKGAVDIQDAVVVVRPDGYIGAVAPLDELGHITRYFLRFMKEGHSLYQ